MLTLFGAPHLEHIIRGYTQAAPLADGWRSRVPLHQLHPLLVHVCLFGAGYREPVLAAAQAALSSLPAVSGTRRPAPSGAQNFF
jgi:fructosamine-3-kinase